MWGKGSFSGSKFLWIGMEKYIPFYFLIRANKLSLFLFTSPYGNEFHLWNSQYFISPKYYIETLQYVSFTIKCILVSLNKHWKLFFKQFSQNNEKSKIIRCHFLSILFLTKPTCLKNFSELNMKFLLVEESKNEYICWAAARMAMCSLESVLTHSNS